MRPSPWVLPYTGKKKKKEKSITWLFSLYVKAPPTREDVHGVICQSKRPFVIQSKIPFVR